MPASSGTRDIPPAQRTRDFAVLGDCKTACAVAGARRQVATVIATVFSIDLLNSSMKRMRRQYILLPPLATATDRPPIHETILQQILALNGLQLLSVSVAQNRGGVRLVAAPMFAGVRTTVPKVPGQNTLVRKVTPSG